MGDTELTLRPYIRYDSRPQTYMAWGSQKPPVDRKLAFGRDGVREILELGETPAKSSRPRDW